MIQNDYLSKNQSEQLVKIAFYYNAMVESVANRCFLFLLSDKMLES